MRNHKIRLLQDLVGAMAVSRPDSPALLHRKASLTFTELAREIERFAVGICGVGLEANDRVAVYLPKQFEAVTGFFGAAAAGGVAVPVNPMLKPAQVAHILRDCNVRFLVTSKQRCKQLAEVLRECPDLHAVILTSPAEGVVLSHHTSIMSWQDLLEAAAGTPIKRIDSDMASILYTSGSTGAPKGVVLSHANINVINFGDASPCPPVLLLKSWHPDFLQISWIRPARSDGFNGIG